MLTSMSNSTIQKIVEEKDLINGIDSSVSGVNKTVELSFGPLQITKNQYFGTLRVSTYVKQTLKANVTYTFNLSDYAIPRFSNFYFFTRGMDSNGAVSGLEVQFSRKSSESSELTLRPIIYDIPANGALNFQIFFWI